MIFFFSVSWQIMEDPDDNRRQNSVSRRVESPKSSSRHESADRSQRRLRSPPRSRSRSQLRVRSPILCDPDIERDRKRVKALEAQLLSERERLLHAEERWHSSTHRRCGGRTRSPSPSNVHVRPATPSQRMDVGQHNRHRESTQAAAERWDDAGYTRSRSPSITKKDFLDIFNCLKDSLTSQPSTGDVRSAPKIDHMNILPNFNPSQKNQRIDVWLKKVNECATVYGWDDRTTTHFAMQKLQGLARIWYEGLNSVLYSWQEWQDKLVTAFPFEQNYGQALEDISEGKVVIMNRLRFTFMKN